MGTWGFRPQDSDQAHDLNYVVEMKANQELAKLFPEYKKHEIPKVDELNQMWQRIGALFINLLKGNTVTRDLIVKAYNELSWLSSFGRDYGKKYGWTSPDLLIESIELHREILRAILKKNWGDGTIYLGRNFTDAYNAYMKPLMRKTDVEHRQRAKKVKPIVDESKPAYKEPKEFVVPD
jgi:hypothetical protein